MFEGQGTYRGHRGKPYGDVGASNTREGHRWLTLGSRVAPEEPEPASCWLWPYLVLGVYMKVTITKRHQQLLVGTSPFDYSAKNRRDYKLPLCHIDDDPLTTSSGPAAALGTTNLSSLLGRAVVDDYTCAPDRPCSNKACCPKATLECNYGEEACGTSGVSPNDVCWSNCDAKSECGKDAKTPGLECPLNVCCGKWGFCGMTDDYCDVKDHGATGGCQSNCNQPGPKNKANSQSRVIGYYEAWRFDSECQGMSLNDIPVNSLTHLYFSFGSITPGDYSITGMEGLPGWLFSNFTDLKQRNPALKTVIAIGGWTFNDPGPTQTVFSNMVSTKASRKTFIDNLISFLREYAFDGVDFDWEYPGADDRGGVETDGANFVQFLKELDDENKKQPVKYVVSFTAPTSYWYLRHFDLKAVDHVDFINVMSYDLHGIWDGKNPIGQHIYGHTNLTEMKSAFDLFWRNDVPANKLNMGLGFYGRAFQLEDPACSKPGCNFKGGATKGGCSDESGILSYREITDIVRNKKLHPVHDKTAGVKYITWNTDQWVSYDDADTFAQKKDLAKDLGLGGFLIWAIDQDDDSLTALQAVISPKKLGDMGAASGQDDWQSSNKHCYVTPCDGRCDPGDIKITEQKCGTDDKRSRLCCPLSGAPDPEDCTWRGNPWYCNGHCHDDEVMMEMNKWGGDNNGCHDGNKAYCCKSPLAEENRCYWAGVGASCNGDDLPLTFSGSVLTILEDVAKIILRVVGRSVPLAALTGEALLFVLDELDLDTDKRYCCPKGDVDKWTNCAWYGEPGSCYDGHCPDMTFVQLTDSYFGGGETCGIQLSRVRTFCCEPKDDPLFLPVPLEKLFAHPPSGDNIDTDFTLETDKTSDSQQDPNDAAFQFVVLASPETLQVSLDKRDGSHWDVFGCDDGVTEGEHTVQMVCTDFSDDSNCYKIGLGYGVPGTILQMPAGCGPGKYAVAKNMIPSTTGVLPRHLSHLASHSPVVYDLTFDYDFMRVPRDQGDTQMRIDFSNQDDYWDTVVAGAATKKKKMKRSLEDVGGNHVRWLEEEFRDDYHFGALERRDLEARWFGSSILAWLAQMVKPEIKREFTHKYEDTLTAKLIDETWSCTKGDVSYEGHLLAQALLKIKIESSFGFTLIVTKLSLPLDLSQSYLTFYNKGEVTGVLTLEAVAKVFYSKGDVIVNIPFPGASFKIPGIATIGPQLTVEGSIDASLSLAGTIETKLEIASWEVRQVVPDDNNDEYKPKEIGDGKPNLDQTGSMDGIQKPEFYAGVQVQGDVTAKLSAAAEFGVRFDPKWDVDPAAAAVVGEASVMVKLNGGISTQGTCPFTWGLDVGARLYARVKAPQVFKWPGVEYDITPKYNKPIVKQNTCPELGPIPTRRDLGTLGFTSNSSSALSVYGRGLEKRAAVWGPVLSVPVGKYFCPSSVNEDENSGTPCSMIEPAWDDDVFLTDGDGDDYLNLRRRELLEMQWSDPYNETVLEPRDIVLEERNINSKRSKLCGINIAIRYPTGGDSKVSSNPIYGFRRPDVCEDYEFGSPLDAGVKTNPPTQYDSEHVLEFQLPQQLFAHLDLSLGPFDHPDPTVTRKLSFCELVQEHWDIPAVPIPGLDTSMGVGASLTPANHVAQQFPTNLWKTDEYVLLEHYINTPAKGKAWGGTTNEGAEMQIIDTSRWIQDLLITRQGASRMIKSMRYLIGSRMYHNDFYIREILRRQKDRVGNVLDLLDTQILQANPRNPAPYQPWQTLGLKAEWDTFMKGKFALVQTKTMKVINEFLPRLQEQWADEASRQAAVIDPDNDDANTQANKQELQDLIDKIDAMESVVRALPVWTWPF
ncbi:carbohydrate-binding module family 18 [Daldinia vernicosa]|uniref:carbohydrate-binding module family 18 n=1 Tax=Daldinia vernicosa TaxID=114800 RepID=UPI002008A939|nr:carbohydrate-binding module family 18 [Daldinia vernicosa]KAI0850294.1 carbohydrate-binding module family 18 [Daldinia vernicosa]